MNLRPRPTPTRLLLSAVALAALGLAACNQTPAYRPPPGSLEEPLPQNQYPNINVHQPLTRYILVADPVVSRDSMGTLRVDVPIRANVRPNEDLNVQYRFQFLDEMGRLLEPEPAWQYIRLEPTIQAFVSANAMDARATDWRLEIKPAR